MPLPIRPLVPHDVNALRPCNQVELCRRDEAKACDNCYDLFWRPHSVVLASGALEDIEAAFQAAADAEADHEWKSGSLF